MPFLGFEPHLFCQFEVSGKYVTRIPAAAVLEEVADTLVNRNEFFCLTETLAVFGIDHDNTSTLGDRGLLVTAGSELDPVLDPGSGGVLPCRFHGFFRDIRGKNSPFKRPFQCLSRLFPKCVPAGFFKAFDMHEPEIVPQEARRTTQCDQGRFDGQCSAPAHGVDKGAGSVPTAGYYGGRGSCLPKWRFKGYLPVTPM